jgi:hypothetical protein
VNTTVFLFRRQSKTVTYAETHATASDSRRLKHYLIGVLSPSLAQKIQHTLDGDEPGIRMYHSPGERRIFDQDRCTTLDAIAKLHIPKTPTPTIPASNTHTHTHTHTTSNPVRHHAHCPYDLHRISLHEFMQYPHTRNVGIIMPYDVDFNSATELVVSARIIEPSSFAHTCHVVCNKKNNDH